MTMRTTKCAALMLATFACAAVARLAQASPITYTWQVVSGDGTQTLAVITALGDTSNVSCDSILPNVPTVIMPRCRQASLGMGSLGCSLTTLTIISSWKPQKMASPSSSHGFQCFPPVSHLHYLLQHTRNDCLEPTVVLL